MAFESLRKHHRAHSRSHSASNANGIITSDHPPTAIGTRRPSLTSKKSSQRLMKTISIDLEDTVSFSDNDYLSESNITQDELSSVQSKDNTVSSVLPNLSSLRIANGTQTRANNNDALCSDFIEVPFVKAILDISLPQDYLKDDILNMIQTLRIPKWFRRGHSDSPYHRDQLNLIKISGAMTNAIFKIEYKGLPSLLLRVYGQNNESIIDRDYELQLLARLSIQNIGPSLYGCFQNGRFEQFLENAVTLTKDDIRNWITSQRIARRMKELHQGVPLLRQEIDDGPISWQKINKWLNIMESYPNWINDSKNIENFLNCANWEQFKSNINKYRQWLLNKDSSFRNNRMVFCHNDTQYGNLLFNSPIVNRDDEIPLTSNRETSPDSERSLFPSTSNVSLTQIINPTRQDQIQDKNLVVIDFEYSGPNPASYDLANHFSEWMYDYNCSEPWSCNNELFPTKEQLLNFLYSYVSHLKGSTSENIKELDEEVKFYYNDVIRWRATIQLFWSCWAIIQCGQLQNDTNEEREPQKFDGINGEKYIITVDDPSVVTDMSHQQQVEDTDDEGVNIDTFDYMKYCSDKISVFWGDLIGLGIISNNEILDISRVKHLDVRFL